MKRLGVAFLKVMVVIILLALIYGVLFSVWHICQYVFTALTIFGMFVKEQPVETIILLGVLVCIITLKDVITKKILNASSKKKQNRK